MINPKLKMPKEESKGAITLVMILHTILSGDFITDFFSSQTIPVFHYVNESIIMPASQFLCCSCIRGLVYNLQKFIPRKLHFFINGGLLFILFAEKYFYDYFFENFSEKLKIEKSKLDFPIQMALVFGFLTILFNPFIPAKDEKFMDQLKRKLEWLSNASGVKGFELPKCVTCEIPLFIRAHHCGVCSKDIKNI